MDFDFADDVELLRSASSDPLAFAAFYERHERAVFAYLYRRTRNVELAADLSAETFARALLAAERYRPGPAPALAWLLGIARNVLGHSLARHRVDERARKKLAMTPLILEDSTVESLERLHARDLLGDALSKLPAEQADAVRARVVDERDYGEIAGQLQLSEAVVRKRVSRGLANLRRHVQEAP